MSLRVSGLALKLPILSVLVTIALLVGFMAPTTAWASDGEEEPTGFLAGLDTLVNPDSVQEVENDPVRDYEYEPVLLESESVRAGEGETEEGGLVSSSDFSSVINAAYRVPMGSGTYGLLSAIPRLFTVYGVAGIAITLVFFWWGLRKALSIVMAAWRRGHASS